MIIAQKAYPIKLWGCIVIGIIGTVGCAVDLLRQIIGYEDKHSARFIEESQKRMQDRDYVEKLVSYGYVVPDTYRN